MASDHAAEISLNVRRLRPDALLPRRASSGASGFDLYACIPDAGRVELSADPTLIPTGIAIEIPTGYDVQIRPRSGLTARGVLAAFGTIDADYRGELFVTMYVYGSRLSFVVSHGERIAQLVVARLAPLAVVEVERLSSTERGEGGHGSTGVR